MCVAVRCGGRPCARRECERARETSGRAGSGRRAAPAGERGRRRRPKVASSRARVPRGREPGPGKPRPRTRAPAAPGQRPLTSSSGGGGVGGGGAREANPSCGEVRQPRRSSAQVSGERGAGRGQAARTRAAPALALAGGPPQRTPGSLVQLAVPGDIPSRGPPPRRAGLAFRPLARPPRPPAAGARPRPMISKALVARLGGSLRAQVARGRALAGGGVSRQLKPPL